MDPAPAPAPVDPAETDPARDALAACRNFLERHAGRARLEARRLAAHGQIDAAAQQARHAAAFVQLAQELDLAVRGGPAGAAGFLDRYELRLCGPETGPQQYSPAAAPDSCLPGR